MAAQNIINLPKPIQYYMWQNCLPFATFRYINLNDIRTVAFGRLMVCFYLKIGNVPMRKHSMFQVQCLTITDIIIRQSHSNNHTEGKCCCYRRHFDELNTDNLIEYVFPLKFSIESIIDIIDTFTGAKHITNTCFMSTARGLHISFLKEIQTFTTFAALIAGDT